MATCRSCGDTTPRNHTLCLACLESGEADPEQGPRGVDDTENEPVPAPEPDGPADYGCTCPPVCARCRRDAAALLYAGPSAVTVMDIRPRADLRVMARAALGLAS